MDSQQHVQASIRGKAISYGWMLVVGIIFIGANLRAPLTSVGPLVGTIRDDLGISNTLAGMITTLPLLAFALLSPFAPKLARRFGMPQVLFVAVILLTIGIVLRSSAGAAALFVGTALMGLSISVCNVLLPSLIKQKYPHKIGVMTGIYSVSMNLCGAIASGISVPFATQLHLGWSGALGIWAILALAACVLWIPQLRKERQKTATVSSAESGRTNIWKSLLAWQVTLFMGLQSMVFYVIITWLPEILEERGIGSSSAGWILSIMQLAVLPFTFIVPILAGRMKSQRFLVFLTALFFLLGTGGILFGSSSLVLLWAVCIGIASGSAFSLAMMFFGLRTRTTHEAAELSGMAQSVGYLLAAVGPTLFGFLHDSTHSWTPPLILLAAASLLIFVFGLGAARNSYVGKA